MSSEERIIRELEALLQRMRSRYDVLVAKYAANDLRAAAIGLPGNTLHSYLLFFAMAEYTITHESWWQVAYHRETPSASDLAALRNLESMTKHSFFVFFVSRVEWTFRKLVTYLSPGACHGGSAPFKEIYDHLFAQLALSQYTALYDLSRHLRNTVHSNGMFVAPSGKDRVVTWKGVAYTFLHMQPITFATHDLLLALFADLIDSLEAVLAHPRVASPPFIEDRIY